MYHTQKGGGMGGFKSVTYWNFMHMQILHASGTENETCAQDDGMDKKIGVSLMYYTDST